MQRITSPRVFSALVALVVSTALPAVPARAWFDEPALVAKTSRDFTDSQWALDAVDARAAWQVSRGAGVTVAVVDSGVVDSYEFAGRLDPMVAIKRGTVVAAPTKDTHGHGTHIAGIIAAADDGRGVTGVAPAARVLPISVIDEPTNKSVVLAIQHAVNSGARVVNLSLGFDTDDGVCDAVAKAEAAGVLIIAAAGNDGDMRNPAAYPAACPSAISVAALSSRFAPATFSSFDQNVVLSAPGVDVLSVLPPASMIASDSGEHFGIAELSGTSQAAPVVSGIAALLLAVEPHLTPKEVRERLTKSAHDLGTEGWDAYTGFGIPSAARVLGLDAPALPVVRHISAKLFNDSRSFFFASPSDLWTVSWQPSSQLPSRYVLHRHGPAGVTTFEIDRTAVRFNLGSIVEGEWFELTAEYPDRSVSSFPVGLFDDAANEPQQVRIKRLSAKTVAVSFTIPRDADEWVVALLTPDGIPLVTREGGRLAANVRKVVKLKLPLKLEPQLTAERISAGVVVFSNGEPSVAQSRSLAPLHVLAVESATRLTATSVRVVGYAVDDVARDCRRARRRQLCVGDTVSVRVDGRSTTARIGADGFFVTSAQVRNGARRVAVSAHARRNTTLTSAKNIPITVIR
jgi:hypothetical protein